MTDSTTHTKQCSKCKEVFLRTPDYFHRCPANNDGLSYVCKGCKHGNGWREQLPKGMRRCKTCKEIFAETEIHFPLHKNTLRHVCHTCYKKQRANKYLANREQITQQAKERYQANPETYKARSKQTYHANPERSKTYSQQWRAAHPEAKKRIYRRYYDNHREEIRARQAIHRIVNADKERERHRDYAQRNPEKGMLTLARRRARLLGAEGTHTVQEKIELYTLQEQRCGYCGIPVSPHIKRDRHLDHMTPITRGGSNSIENLLYTCRYCNQSKGQKTVAEWFAVRGW